MFNNILHWIPAQVGAELVSVADSDGLLMELGSGKFSARASLSTSTRRDSEAGTPRTISPRSQPGIYIKSGESRGKEGRQSWLR